MMSDLAESWGLRTSEDLNAWIAAAGLEVIEKSIPNRTTLNRKMPVTHCMPRVARK